MANALARATSPYLLQHAQNPVDWREWGPQTLAEARRLDKPILLSIGYAACHWCHVMAHESFENDAIAAAMNEHFVNIKVDREERPDLDQIYQNALAMLGQQGGWPLTMFLTPAGEPFWGGTYFPPESRYGRPGFPEVLAQIATLWSEDRPRVEHNREALAGALAQLGTAEAGDAPAPREVHAIADAVGDRLDAALGGLAGAPKFPQAPIMDLLLRSALARGDGMLKERVIHSLNRIVQGGIYDHVGGGMARYSVDAFWLVPHFEKMLYDNAQLLSLLAKAWTIGRDPLFAARIEETIAWLEREMVVEGAYAASLDADSEGEEGKFYVWRAPEIDALLGGAAPSFKLAYGVTGNGNWEGGNILNRLHERGLPEAQQEETLAAARRRLLAARETRPRPGRDDKLLADWNGLAIRGLVDAGLALDRADWIAIARRVFDAILALMEDGERLAHSYRAGKRLPQTFLDDYAQMALAAARLFEATGDSSYLRQAATWTTRCDRDFAAPDGGFFVSAEGEGDLIVRPRNAHDGPVPSAAAVLAAASVRMWLLTGNDGHRSRADGMLRAFGGEARRNPFAHGALLGVALERGEPLQVVVIGRPDEPGFAELRAAAAGAAVPDLALLPLSPDDALPPSHPAFGKPPLDGRPTAYVCRGMACLPPVTSPGELRGQLEDGRFST